MATLPLLFLSAQIRERLQDVEARLNIPPGSLQVEGMERKGNIQPSDLQREVFIDDALVKRSETLSTALMAFALRQGAKDQKQEGQGPQQIFQWTRDTLFSDADLAPVLEGMGRFDREKLSLLQEAQAQEQEVVLGSPAGKSLGKVTKIFPRGDEVIVLLKSEGFGGRNSQHVLRLSEVTLAGGTPPEAKRMQGAQKEIDTGEVHPIPWGQMPVLNTERQGRMYLAWEHNRLTWTPDPYHPDRLRDFSPSKSDGAIKVEGRAIILGDKRVPLPSTISEVLQILPLTVDSNGSPTNGREALCGGAVGGTKKVLPFL